MPLDLELTEHLPAPPERAFPWISEPSRMNRWSTAAIRALEPGDRGREVAMGALREVRIPVGPWAVPVTEVIEACEPPRRYVYRVVPRYPLRDHRGELTLTPAGPGSLLRWTVSIDHAAPFAERLLGALLEPELARSLARLAATLEAEERRAGSAPAERVAPAADDPLDASAEPDGLDAEPLDEGDMGALWAQAARVRDEQEALADRFAREGNDKYWFTRDYQYVTEEQMRSCRERRVTHPGWVLRLIVCFHRYYAESLYRYLGEAPGAPEPHWARAFAVMDDARLSPAERMQRGLHLGVRAHIEDDLPRALREVHEASYAGRCSLARFRADYLLMGGVLQEATRRILREVPRGFMTPAVRWSFALLPFEACDAIVQATFYDAARERRAAFARAERLLGTAGIR